MSNVYDKQRAAHTEKKDYLLSTVTCSEIASILRVVTSSLLGEPDSKNLLPCMANFNNWQLLLDRTWHHRLTAPLLRYCHHNQITIPEEILSTLIKRRRNDYFRRSLYIEELTSLLPLIYKKTDQVIPFKGLMVAEELYPDPWMRTFSDIDILTTNQSCPIIIELLLERGYTPDPILSEYQIQSELKNSGGVSFKHHTKPLNIDLHTHVTSPMVASERLIEQFFRSSVKTELFGTPLRIFSPADQIIMLTLHGEKHQWRRLHWIIDVALAFKKYCPQIIEEAISKAGKFHLRSSLQLSWLLSREFASQSLGSKNLLFQSISTEAFQVKQKIIDEFNNPQQTTIMPLNLHGMVQLRKTLRQKLWYFLHRLVTPSLTDFRAIRLPDSLKGAYFIIRPLRLLIKHIRRAFVYLKTTHNL